MTLTFDLPPAVQKQLARRPDSEGKTVEKIATGLFQKSAPEKTMDEILAPFRKEFAESGMTEEEWDTMIEEARQEVWEEKNGRPLIVEPPP